MMLRFLLVVFFFVASTFATHVAVLETGADESAKDKVSLSDRQYLTNVLREQAVKELPAVQNYTIMTRENISAMLPPGKAIEDCEGSCLAETGRNIAADYICQARVGVFGTSLTLSAELYETAGNKLIASFNGLGENVGELLEIIKQKSPEFFRSVKGGFGVGVGGFGFVDNSAAFDYQEKKKYIVEIVSEPSGAVPTIDGQANPKCLSTPCKMAVEEGSHLFVVTKERYMTTEQVVDVKQNDQKVTFTLQQNFGWLEVNPILVGPANKGTLSVSVDGSDVEGTKVALESGMHNIHVTHPCYDPMDFKVSIVRGKTQVFDKEMPRGLGGLDLNAEYQGVPQVVPVYLDGVLAGNTPFTRKIPLCSDIVLKGNGWEERVDANPEWHKVVRVTHNLKHDPKAVAAAEDTVKLAIPTTYEADEESQWNGFVAASDDKAAQSSGGTSWGLFTAGMLTMLSGVVFWVVGNELAAAAAEKEYDTEDEYEENLDDARYWQTFRNVGIGATILGALGIVLSIDF